MKTNEEIDLLEAGRELDALVSEVMGMWRTPLTQIETQVALKHEIIPHYSTDIAAAWEVAEICRMVVRPSLAKGWIAGMLHSVTLSGKVEIVKETYAEGDTAPLAICKSALRIARLESA